MKDLGAVKHAGSAEFNHVNVDTLCDSWLAPPAVSNQGRDGGLFTGETVLHIAIVQKRLDSIKWLLDHGSELTCRAVGLFFQGMKIPKFTDDMTWRMETLAGMMAKLGSVHSVFNFEENMLGGSCSFGEFPLSFAAAVGDACACHLLRARAKELIGAAILKDMTIFCKHNPTFNERLDGLVALEADSKIKYVGKEEPKKIQAGLDKWIIENVKDGHKIVSRYRKVAVSEGPVRISLDLLDEDGGIVAIVKQYLELLLSAFLNRRNSEGDTALHLAVRLTIPSLHPPRLFLLHHTCLPLPTPTASFTVVKH
jgi:hypothetical protein